MAQSYLIENRCTKRVNFLMFGLVLLTLVSCSRAPEVTLIEGQTMGTTYSVKVIDAVDKTRLSLAIETRLVAINQLMSTYISDSEISQLNQMPVGDAMTLSAENLSMLDLSRQLNVESDGKFDVSLGPLISLWGFGADPRRTEVPPQRDIDQALAQMGINALEIGAQSVRKLRPVALDFSSIAKGYGVDELARIVEAAGGTNYLVEIGGELKARGVNEHGSIWRIGIETPDLRQRVPFAAIALDDLAMATSGDYRNYFEVNGKRFSHTLDPSSGYPISHNVASVTVLAKTAAEADGYATAINVMGAEQGLKLANQKNLPAFVILKAEEGFVTRSSQAFKAYLLQHQ